MRTFVKWSVRVFVLLLVLAAAAYPVADLLREPMDDLARAALARAGKADRFATLSAGVMHVRVGGPEEGPPEDRPPEDRPVVLMVHGAATGGFAFQRWIKPLSDAGFRVIVPDMFGYGYSDRPSARHDEAFFMAQLDELLEKLNATGPLHIVGTSMGGAISTDFAAANPKRVRSLTLIAPAGLGEARAQVLSIAQLLVMPVVGDWIARVPGPALIVAGIMQSPVGGAEGLGAWMSDQVKYRGFVEGQLNTFRNYDVQNRRASYDAVGRAGLPVLAIWGTGDTVVPFAHSKELLARVRQARLVPVDGEPHGLPLLRPEATLAIVLPFLQAHRGPLAAAPPPP